MQNIALQDGPVEVVGALDLDHSPTGIVPRRLPAWTRPQIPDLFMDVVVQLPSGVRLRFATTSTRVELDVLLTNLSRPPMEQLPAVFDLTIDGEIVDQQRTTEGHLIILGPGGPADITFAAGEPTTLTFEDLPAGLKVVELWLPQASGVELRSLRIEDGATAEAAPANPSPRWVHYGSSISHCVEASSPTATWPAVAAHQAGVNLHSLGLAGQCMLDQFVARTIRDLPADVISLKVGINVVNGDTLRERTFGPALHGFLDTIREKRPDTPILLVSPIFCPSAEDRPGPTIPNADGRYITVDGLEDLRLTCLTLNKIRTAIASIVETRRGLGDTNLHYLNGLELFGADDAADLHDDLHPNAAGYVRIGQRFAELAFGPGGPLTSINQ
jgi:GDSL-like Lipase/Acylhydrolase family